MNEVPVTFRRAQREDLATLVQLTTDKRRPRAWAFYEALGFQANHEGMKLVLVPADTSHAFSSP